MTHSRSIIFPLLILLVLPLFITACGNQDDVQRLTQLNRELRQELSEAKVKLESASQGSEKEAFLSINMRDIKARIVTNKGTIEVEFYPEAAPIHVFNFVTRAESGFYDGTKFHRVIPGFMIQGGDPNTRTDNRATYGQGGPIVSIPHEFNDITHSRGVLSMARVSDVRQGAGSQFFIMHADTPRLDNEYTVFGKATSGLDVVDAIANTETSSQFRDQPVEHVIIERIEVFR